MADFLNTFSWSFSAGQDFNTCHRKRYWSKYAMWGGWKSSAPKLSKDAYRLGKMVNRHTLKGDAVELACLWLIEQQQKGLFPPAEEAYESIAKPFLERCWMESKREAWRSNPKKYACLHEHYYGGTEGDGERAMVAKLREECIHCLTNFVDKVLPKLTEISLDDEIPVQTVSMGDPESFEFDGLKIYSIPDYVYAKDGILHIHDWKAGKRLEHHRDQIMIYGLWALSKKGKSLEQLRLHVEYLALGETDSFTMSDGDLESVKERIARSSGEMLELLVEGDMVRNQPVDVEHWALTAEPSLGRWPCRLCEFYELCEPEITGS